ncbi:hypothetical protein KOW79_002725 [Hemibagrus wyckioides]|uniref:Vinculin n=2 Tax=Hemibagrus wyckioides TaxID=337641 RepID=A0A9D3P7J8_9TELE|nr:hypothetical protein KOW79_002725 [Hemibagrus wyckioides]
MAFLVEDSLIKTSLIEQVVAPITAHICYLTLLSEADDTSGQFIQLEASARAVAKASRNMADVASRVMAESDDDVMRLEMGLLLEPLMMSGQHVLLATQKLSIQPEVREHREELIEATQNVLLGVVKVLLVEDDASVRKITTAAHWLLDCLRNIGDATDMSSLLKAFQAFSKALLSLHDLVMNRVKDLRDHRHEDCVKTSVEILRRSISMLHTAMYTTIKHPTSEVAQESKNYILQLVESTIHDIIMTFEGNCQCLSVSLCGYYTDKRIRLLKSLSDPAFNLFKDSNFDAVLRDLVFHSMAVANSCQREIRSCVTANCKLVLQLWSEISQQMRQININCTDKQEPKDHQEKLRVSLMIQIHELDEAVVKATLYQVIDTFVLTSGPLEQLVNTIHNLFEADLEVGLDLDPIQTLSKTFISYADRMAKVARFVSALATDEKSLESLENSVSCLLRLKDGVVPLLLELEGDSVQYHGALHKLIIFHQKWEEETEQLLNAFCDIINVKDFIHLSVLEMKHDLDKCVEAHKSQDHHLLSKHLRLLIGRMSQVVQFVRRCVDKSDDPIYRNGLLVLVKQAERSLAEVTGYATDIFNTKFQDEAFPLSANSITLAIKNFDVLHEGLDGLQHPHLLSPLREGARQVASTPPVPSIEEPKKTTNNEAKTESLDNRDEKENLAIKLKVTTPEKKHHELTTVHQPESTEVKKPLSVDSKSVQMSHSADLLPLLYEVVNMSKDKNVEALNIACTRIMELSTCYTQATKEVASIVEENANQEMETLRSELITLTPLLVQTAQETAMSSVKIIDTVYKHSAQFSDLIKTTHNILLPVTGMWYHAIKAMIHSHTANMVDNCIQELTDVICLCSDTVELVTSADIKVRSSDSNDSITSLLSKLQKAQTNTKNLTDLLVSKTSQSDGFDGPCILWALSIQVLLTSLDRIFGMGTTHGRGQLSQHQMTPKKWFATMSENSLRIQEAARLSSLNCTDSCKAKLLKERDDVKALSEVYLQATDDLGTISRSGVLRLARTELLQRQLQIKMKSLCCVLSKVNEEYVTAIQNIISLACSAIIKKCSMEADEIRTQFDATAEVLLRNVKSATESVQECLNFMRDPRERSNLRFISDHLSFQMSEIVSRAKLIMETQTVSETLSIDIQTQCWSAKAHYLVEELYKVDGIFPVTKEQIKLGLQGKAYSGVLQTDIKQSSITETTKPPRKVISEKASRVNIPPVRNQESKMSSAKVPVFSSLDPSLAYTSLFLKQEAERWDVRGNQIVKVTREMADKIYDMTQYLKRKGPIQSKDAFVSSAKDLVLSCQTVTHFVKIIADHCLDQHSNKELCIIAERIVTITNQLTIISR